MSALARSSEPTRTMTRATFAAVVLLGLIGAGALSAQLKPVFETARIGDGVYELSTDGGGYPAKVIASAGVGGRLIVDSGDRTTGNALADALRTFGEGLPRIIINTHSHIEHVGGNPEVGRGAVIVGHKNLRERYVSGLYAIGDFPAGALPNLTFNDSLVLHFNGDEIRLVAFPGRHDDSDILVWFTRSKVAVVGALCMGRHFPSVDADTGSVLRYPDVTSRVLAMLPADTRIVPGHADDCTLAEGRDSFRCSKKPAQSCGPRWRRGKTWHGCAPRMCWAPTRRSKVATSHVTTGSGIGTPRTAIPGRVGQSPMRRFCEHSERTVRTRLRSCSACYERRRPTSTGSKTRR
jgi:glyoxylase-like metal-dependent hydrolase (beta-lactamase superfamily II)